jgi:hypothetical protein
MLTCPLAGLRAQDGRRDLKARRASGLGQQLAVGRPDAHLLHLGLRDACAGDAKQRPPVHGAHRFLGRGGDLVGRRLGIGPDQGLHAAEVLPRRHHRNRQGGQHRRQHRQQHQLRGQRQMREPLPNRGRKGHVRVS